MRGRLLSEQICHRQLALDVIRIAARRKSIVGDHRDEELSQLNAITTSFLDLAESRARRHIVTTMEDWKNRLKLLRETMDYDAKNSAGKVSQEEVREKAYSEYEKLFKTVPIFRISTDSIVAMMMILHCFHLTLIQKNWG